MSMSTNQKFLLFLLRRLVIKSTGLDDLVIDVELKPSSSVHRLFDALLGDEAQDTN